jgi:glycosyltransferase involved in cell wall biosynthesis
LVLVGKFGWWRNRVLELIGSDRSIRYLGPVSEDELVALYAAAQCFVYPSQEEGFGFPPLEAMACGTPVVASNSSSIPEVVGNAGVLVDPKSVHRLAEAMEATIGNSKLRDQLRQRGFRRIKHFSWEETARQTLAVYHKVVAS